MKDLVEKFTNQLLDAIKIGDLAELNKTDQTFKNITITGLGGSGIGGKIVSQLVQDQLNIPILISSNYTIPDYIDNHSLVIVSSFSGNTEETLAAMKSAESKGAEIACITSGGKLEQWAKEKNYNYIILPTERSPRAMLTYSMVQQFYLLNHYGFINDGFKKQILAAIELLNDKTDHIKEKAKLIASSFQSKTPVLYSEASLEGATIRMRQQINENAKQLCWHHVLPEMNHNELVGWAGGKNEYAVLFLRTSYDHPRSKVRMDICKNIISKYTDNLYEIYAEGNSLIEQTLYLILFGDWVSVYLADLNKVDSIEVNVIDYLKSELSKI
jgi:glucose/mannose-6-phosphate isomerase